MRARPAAPGADEDGHVATRAQEATRHPGLRTRASATPEKTVTRRWTPPEVFKPLIITVLEQAGGELEADELFLELEILAEDRLRPDGHRDDARG